MSAELDEATEGRLLSESGDFGLARPAAARPLPVIEAELDILEKDTRQREASLIENYIEVGRRLEEVKAQLPHGEWGPWLERRGYPQAKAVKLMKVFRAYGKEQQSLFGSEAKSQAFANLGFHKLVQLLAIEDEGERESFVVEHDVANMSTRELDEALKARDEAEEKAIAAKEEAVKIRREADRLQEQLESQAQVYEAKLTSARAEADLARKAEQKEKDAWKTVENLRKEAREAEKQARKERDEAKLAAQAAEEEQARLSRELEELRSRPVDVAVEADQEAVARAREEAAAEMAEKVKKAKDAKKAAEEKRKAAEEALASARKELEELKARGPEVRELTQEEKNALTAEAVEQAKAEGAEQIRSLEKKLAMADQDTAALMVLYQSWTETYQKMWDALRRIEAADSSKAQRLRDGIRKAAETVAEQMRLEKGTEDTHA